MKLVVGLNTTLPPPTSQNSPNIKLPFLMSYNLSLFSLKTNTAFPVDFFCSKESAVEMSQVSIMETRFETSTELCSV